MAEKFVSPNGDEYEWKGDNPPTPADIEAMVKADAERAVMRTEWQYGTPMKRIGLMAKWGGKVLLDLGIEGAAATAGYITGERLGGPMRKVTGPIGGSIGGATGNFIVQTRRMMDGSQEGIKVGELIASAEAGAIPPGAPKGVVGAVKEGAKMAVGNVAAEATATAVDEHKPLSGEQIGQAVLGGVAGAQMAQVANRGKRAGVAAVERRGNVPRDNTFEMAKALGYGLDPAQSNPSLLTKSVDRVAGQTQVQRALIFKNQKVTNAIAAAEIGLPIDKPLSESAILLRKFELGEPYREVSKISPEAASDLKSLKRKRLEARENWKKYGREGGVDFRDKAVAADDAAEALETALEKRATDAGKPDLVDELRGSRRLLAKVHVVESALNTSNGDVRAAVIGAMYDKDSRRLTDGLTVIGRLDNTMPQVMREAALTQSVGSQPFRHIVAGTGLAVGYQYGGPMGAAVGYGVPMLAGPAATKLASGKAFQQAMALPTYNTGAQDAGAMILRNSAMAGGRYDQAQESPIPPYLRR
jgi:hypothetical protein